MDDRPTGSATDPAADPAAADGTPAPQGDAVTGASAIGARDVGATVAGGITAPDHPDDPDLPENRNRRPAQDPPGVEPLKVREPLSRARIVDAAVDYVDTHGLPALTMRRLGARLGVEAMALYNYVPSRDDLLNAMIDRIVDELFDDADVYLEPRNGWQDYLQRLAHGVRRGALAHPALFPLVATRPPAAPWVRPPLRSLRWIDSFLTALRTNGFTDEQTVIAYRAYSSFLLGHLLLEVAQRGVAINAVDDPDGDPDATPDDLGDEHRSIAELKHLLALDETVTEFEESLENLIDRLGAMVQDRASHL